MRSLPGALHLLTPFHTVPALEYSHCAFTMKALRFSKMMRGFFEGGIIEYANEGSESLADEHVRILLKSEVRKLFPTNDKKRYIGEHALVGAVGHQLFEKRLIEQMRKRVRQHDFVGHTFDYSHASIVPTFSGAMHVETGIGYPNAPIEGPNPPGGGTTARIYESHCWMHRHLGRWEGTDYGLGTNPCYSFVVPNYFDETEWPYGDGEGDAKGPYVMFMGRLSKGGGQVATLIKAWFTKYPKSPLRFVFAGQGDFKEIRAIVGKLVHKTQYLGPLVGRDRAKWMGRAVASIMPTQFVEPFGGSGVEGMLCGTPLLASDWGAFTETIRPGVNGYRFRTLGDMVRSVELVLEGRLDRKRIAREARERYSLEACRPRYERIFHLLHDLKSGEGAASLRGDTLDEGIEPG